MNTLVLNKKIFFLAGLMIFLFTTALSQTAEIKLQNSLSKIIAPQTPKQQKQGLREFKKEMINNGFKAFPNISKIINIHDKPLNSFETQIMFAQYDRKLFPSNFKIAGEYLKSGDFQKFTGLFFDSIRKTLSNPISSIAFLKVVLKVFYNTCFLFLLLLGIAFLVKYVQSLQHDFNLKYKNKLSKKHVLFLIYTVILLAPLFITNKIYYLPLYWLILFAAYQSKKEIITVCSIGAIAILTTLLTMYLGLVTTSINTDEFHCYQALTTPFSNYTPQKKGDLQTFTKATIELRAQNYREAIALYKQVNQSSPFFPLTLNNLGVAYFKLQELALARDFFNDTIKNIDRIFVPHFNLSMTHLKSFNLAESNNELSTAFNYESGETLKDMMVNIKQINPIIATPQIKEITRKFFGLKFDSKTKFSEVSGFNDFLFFIFIVVTTLILHFSSKNRNTSKACNKCGKPFVYVESQNSNLCKQCVTVFINKDDMDSSKRKEKINTIKHYNKIKQFVETTFALLFPGILNIILKEKIASGIFIFILFFGSLSATIYIFQALQTILIAAPLLLIIGVVLIVNSINVINWYKEESWR